MKVPITASVLTFRASNVLKSRVNIKNKSNTLSNDLMNNKSPDDRTIVVSKDLYFLNMYSDFGKQSYQIKPIKEVAVEDTIDLRTLNY